MKEIYIHRGSDEFYPDDIVQMWPQSIALKPDRALFACKQSSDDWLNWCKSENYGDMSDWDKFFTFTLADTTRLLVVNSLGKEYALYPYQAASSAYGIVYNWKHVVNKYDAVYIDLNADYRLIDKFPLYDVSQLIVFNPDVVELV